VKSQVFVRVRCICHRNFLHYDIYQALPEFHYSTNPR
jgi:hypothetical protein